MISKVLNTIGIKVIISFLNFILIIFTANYLGTNGRGEVSLLIANISFLGILSGFVGGSPFVFLSSRHKKAHLQISGYSWAIFSCVLGGFFLYFSKQVDANLLFHTLLLSMFISFSTVQRMIILGRNKIMASNLISLMQVLPLFVYFYFYHNNINDYISGLYISYSACLLIGFIYISLLDENTIERVNFSISIKNILNYGFKGQLASVISFFNFRLSYYFLNSFVSISGLGIYSTAVSIAEAMWLISKSISMVLYASVANESNLKMAIQKTNKMTRVAFWPTFFLLCVLNLIPQNLYNYLFSKDFYEIKKLILILSPGILLMSFSSSFLHFFGGLGNYKVVNYSTLLSLLATVGLNIIFIPLFDYYGAAIATTLAFSVQSIYLFVIYNKKTKYFPSDLFKIVQDLKDLLKSKL